MLDELGTTLHLEHVECSVRLSFTSYVFLNCALVCFIQVRGTLVNQVTGWLHIFMQEVWI